MEQKSHKVIVGGHESILLPKDLVIEILSRLPVKSLLRAKLVCKAWRSIINSPDFINSHHRFNGNHLYHIVCPLFVGGIVEADDTTPRIHCYDDKLRLVDPKARFSPDFPGVDDPRELIVGSCDGLVLVHLPYDFLRDAAHLIDKRVVWGEWRIWNLATGESRLLPIPSSFKGVQSNHRYFHKKISNHRYFELFIENQGFGFDAKSKDYKAVVIHKLRETDALSVDVYSLRAGSWRNITTSLSNGRNIGSLSEERLTVLGNAAFSNGKLSWCAVGSRENNPRFEGLWNEIISLDVSNEEMLITRLPSVVGQKDISVFAFNESLAIASYEYPYYQPDSRRSFDIWVLGEFGVHESWTKLFTIGPLQGIDEVKGFWKDDKWFVEMLDHMIHVFDLSTQQTTSLEIYGGNMFAYQESLVSISTFSNYIDFL